MGSTVLDVHLGQSRSDLQYRTQQAHHSQSLHGVLSGSETSEQLQKELGGIMEILLTDNEVVLRCGHKNGHLTMRVDVESI